MLFGNGQNSNSIFRFTTPSSECIGHEYMAKMNMTRTSVSYYYTYTTP